GHQLDPALYDVLDAHAGAWHSDADQHHRPALSFPPGPGNAPPRRPAAADPPRLSLRARHPPPLPGAPDAIRSDVKCPPREPLRNARRARLRPGGSRDRALRPRTQNTL